MPRLRSTTPALIDAALARARGGALKLGQGVALLDPRNASRRTRAAAGARASACTTSPSRATPLPKDKGIARFHAGAPLAPGRDSRVDGLPAGSFVPGATDKTEKKG